MCCPGYDINRYLSTFKLFFPPALSGELSKIMKTSEKYKRFSGELQIQVSHIFFVRSHSVVMQISKLIFYVKFFLTTNALFIKDVVYRRKVRDLVDLRQRIIEAVELITPHMLINTWQELQYSLDICRATTGAHIEVYGRV